VQKQTKVVFANICEKSGISKFCGCCGPANSYRNFWKFARNFFFMKWNTADIGLNQNTVFQKIVGGLMHPTGYMMQEFFLYWYIILSG